MNKSIIFSGFGGQGILFAGKLIAYCGMIEEREVSWIPSYGPEMRGGTANCSVNISDAPISSPLFVNPDYLIIMNSPSYRRFIDKVKSDGKAFIDSSMIEENCEREDIQSYYVPATALAEKHGIAGMANIILCGKLLKETGIIDIESVESALKKIIPASKETLVGLNLRALDIGMKI